MKKKVLFSATMMLMFIGGYAGISSSKENNLTTTQLMNVEALVRGEESGRYKCYTSTHYEEGATVVLCKTCEIEYDATDDLFNFHDWCWR